MRDERRSDERSVLLTTSGLGARSMNDVDCQVDHSDKTLTCHRCYITQTRPPNGGGVGNGRRVSGSHLASQLCVPRSGCDGVPDQVTCRSPTSGSPITGHSRRTRKGQSCPNRFGSDRAGNRESANVGGMVVIVVVSWSGYTTFFEQQRANEGGHCATPRSRYHACPADLGEGYVFQLRPECRVACNTRRKCSIVRGCS